MEEDDMVKSRVGNTLSTKRERERERRTDEGGRAVSPRDLIWRCQCLVEGWPWQPPKDPLHLSMYNGI